MKTYCYVALALLAIKVQANNLQPFWKEPFSSSGIPSAWSTGDNTNQGLTWEVCSNFNNCEIPNIQDIWCTDVDFRSNGFEDGFAFIKSVNFPPFPAPSQSYLRTSLIDCSQKNKVFLDFQTYIGFSTTNPETNAILRVKAGNGPWVEFQLFPNLNYTETDVLSSLNAQPVLIDISSVAANQSAVLLEWQWTHHNDLVWMIDDISLFDQNPIEKDVVWGLAPGQGGRFEGGLGSWSVITYGNDYDSCSWVWVNSNKIDNPDDNDKANILACWSGANDGAMLFNASFCSQSPGNSNLSRGDLRSPTIDLSQIPAGTKLLLKFNQIASLANPADPSLPITAVAVSTNNGFSFIETIALNTILPFRHPDCQEIVLPLPISVAGKPQVRLAFMFAGDTDFWMIDDVRITTLPDTDVAINPEFYNVPRDFSVPSNQVSPIDLYAQVRNAGRLSITNVVATVEIRNSSNQIVHADSVGLGMLDPSNSWTEVYFDNPFEPEANENTYTIIYRVFSNQFDEVPSNNKAHSRFKVTGSTFSKNDYCENGAGYFFPTQSYTYTIGNCYYLPSGKNLVAKSMSFAFANADNLASAELGIRLYKWATSSTNGDVDSDTIANDDEIELVAFNAYTVTGDENRQIVTVPVSAENDPIALQDNTHYFVTVGYTDPVAFNSILQRFPIACIEEINYTSTFYNSLSSIPAYTSMLHEGNSSSPSFRANAWALRRIPFINLNVEQVSSDIKTTQKGNIIKAYPNPAKETINLLMELTSQRHSIQAEIFDICGRKVLTKTIDTGNVSQMAIDVSNLSNGTYFFGVNLGESMVTQKLVIMH